MSKRHGDSRREGKVNGASGQVAIQAAFPTFWEGVGYIFVVRATADLSGTDEDWSLMAGAYCTPDTVPIYIEESSAFNGDPIKSVTVVCPQGTRVVGMGGEVSNDEHPFWSIPSAGIRRRIPRFRDREPAVHRLLVQIQTDHCRGLDD